MSALSDIDRRIVNALQGDFPISPRPYAEAAARLGLSEADLIERLRRLVESGAASRFGPLWNRALRRRRRAGQRPCRDRP